MRLESRVLRFLEIHSEIQKTENGFKSRKSSNSVKLPKNFTPDLCRIIGIIHGDGNMSGKRFLITDRNFKYHKYLNKLFRRTFGITLNIFHDKNRNSFYSHSKNSVIYKYLTEVLEIPIGAVRKNLKIPKFIYKLPIKLKSEYVAGLFDSESHIRNRQAEIDFSTTTKEIWLFLMDFFKEIEIKYSKRVRKRRKNPEFELFIYGKNNLNIFNEFVKLKHPEKIDRLNIFLLH